ncbi:hypothetical protein CFN78_21600 [Amycolatopsis antarctica]|uniref:Asp23/Gls24 family envelope stress response protein n=1 Tax=Amycolatopsis antarctica TaxID=1854586 RepID=A0A263CY51_9PSEU|nr:hypothetical protein [Amycolatopsis antarctica]OZM71072.1 hypothetical protein CFN78_21600 [Amycolatopsis antarctica]
MTSADPSGAPQPSAPVPDPRDDPAWGLVRSAAAATVPTPPGLVSRVLRSVRGVRGRLHGEPVVVEQEGGRLHVGERALVLLTRTLATELGAAIGGVHVSAVALEPEGLEVLATVRFGVHADDAGAALRSRLAAALADQLGTTAPPVSVHVVDVHPG